MEGQQNTFSDAVRVIIDTGAGTCATNDRRLIHQFRSNRSRDEATEYEGPQGEVLVTLGTGNLLMNFGNRTLTLPTIYAPKLTHTLISGKSLKEEGVTSLDFQNNKLKDKHGNQAAFRFQQGVIVLNAGCLQRTKTVYFNSIHTRLGHANSDAIQRTITAGLIEGLRKYDDPHEVCVSCQCAKARRAPAIEGSRDLYKQNEPFSMVHTDVCGPLTVGGVPEKYFVILKDDFTKYINIYFLRSKSEVYETLKRYVAYVQTQFHRTVKLIYSDRGTEFSNSEVRNFCQLRGITQRFSPARSPMRNGTAERQMLTILNDTRCLLSAAKLGNQFWVYAARFGVFNRNILMNSDLNDSPFGYLQGFHPRWKNLHSFGTKVIVTTLDQESKLQQRGYEGVYLGPSSISFGYLCLIPELHKVVDTSHVVFLEDKITPRDELDTDYDEDHITTDAYEPDMLEFDEIPTPRKGNLIFNDEKVLKESEPSRQSEIGNRVNQNIETPEEVTENAKEVMDQGTNGKDDQTVIHGETETVPTIVPDKEGDVTETVEALEAPEAPREESIEHEPQQGSETEDGHHELQGNETSNEDLRENDTSFEEETASQTEPQEPQETYQEASPSPEPVNEEEYPEPGYEKPVEVQADRGNKVLEHEVPPNLRSTLVGAPNRVRLAEDDDSIASRLRKRRKLYLVVQMDGVEQVSPIESMEQLPRNFHDAMNSKHGSEWQQAISRELEAHKAMKTWDPVPVPLTSRIQALCVPSKWVFTRKGVNSEIFKARMVARGDYQDESTYASTYSPTLRYELLRMLFSLAVNTRCFIAQYDIKTAYLNAFIDKELYIQDPIPTNGAPKAYRLRRALYGIKQAGYLWAQTFARFLLEQGFQTSYATPSIFKKGVVTIAVFVDDLLVLSSTQEAIDDTYSLLCSRFETKKVEGHVIRSENVEHRRPAIVKQELLGFELYITSQKGRVVELAMKKEKYLHEVKKLFNLPGKEKQPMAHNFYFDKQENKVVEMEPKEWRRRIKRLQKILGVALHVTSTLRPDAAYVSQYLAKFISFPHEVILKRAMMLLDYLVATAAVGITFRGPRRNKLQLLFYSDSDYASDPETRKSQNGYIAMSSNGPISWKSKATALTCQSSAEAEYQAMVLSSNESKWLEQAANFLTGNNVERSVFYVDNISAISIALNNEFRPRTKHFDVRLHVIRDRVKEGMKIEHMSGKQQLADLLTKPVDMNTLRTLRPQILSG